MLPAKRNKVDMKTMTEEEKKLFSLYGKLPTHKDVLGNKLKERKYFDSGDYALSKAGKTSQQSVGTAIPTPETLPHASALSSPPTNAALFVDPFNPGAGAAGAGVGAGSGTGAGTGTGAVPVPGAGTGIQGLGRSPPQVGAFPTGNGPAGSPNKESSYLGRRGTIIAEDLMKEGNEWSK